MKLQGYSDNCIKHLKDVITLGFISTIMFARASGLDADYPLMKRTYRIVKKPVLVLLVYFPLMLIPDVFLRVPVQIFRYMNPTPTPEQQ